MLVEEWYIARNDREERLKAVAALKDAKQQARGQPQENRAIGGCRCGT